MVRSRPAAVAALALLAACQRGAEPAPPPAPAPEAAPRPLKEPTALPQNVSGLLREGVALEPGDHPVKLLSDGPVLVDPRSTFRVVLTIRSPDARLALYDGADAIVPADGGRVVAEATTVTLRPSKSLEPGGLYQLRLDGAASREVHDEAGGAFQPLFVTVQVKGGEAPPPPAAAAARPAGKKKAR